MDVIVWLVCTIAAGVLAYYGARRLAAHRPRLRPALMALTFFAGFVIVEFIDIEPPYEITTLRDGTVLPFGLAMLAWAARAALFGGFFGAIKASVER